MKLVKVGRVGGKVKEVMLNDCDPIRVALNAAGLVQNPGEEIWLDHSRASMEMTPRNGSMVILETPRVSINRLSQATKDLIDAIVDMGFIEEDDYMNEDDNLDYNDIWSDYSREITDIVNSAKKIINIYR